MVHRLSVAVVSSVLALWVGCTSTTDPRQGGLAGGIQGLSSGAYEERIKTRKESLARLQAIRSQLEADKASLQATRREKESEVQEHQRRLEALRTEIEQLVAEVEQFSNQLTHKDKRVVEMRQRLSRLTDDIGELDKARKTEGVQREQLQEQVDALEEEYRKLLDLYIELEK